MPKWISVEKAVIKYHIEKEAILLWVEMGQFPMLYINNVPNVDEECILELFRRSKAGITAEYIDTLEQLCIDKTMVCEKYAHIIQLKEKEIQLQKEINTLINEIQAAMKRQNERIRCSQVSNSMCHKFQNFTLSAASRIIHIRIPMNKIN